MWFKQIQLYQLGKKIPLSSEKLIERLSLLTFKPCLPSSPSSTGWVSPLDMEDAPLAHTTSNYIMICLQIEEKILPATVIRQELNEKIKKIEKIEERKVRKNEKLTLKDEITFNLLTRAFSKLTRIYAYIDVKNNWLILNTTTAKKTEQFVNLFKRTISEDIHPIELNKPSPIITHWLTSQSYPHSFSIEKTCMLQDPQQQNRIIRCQHQDLFAKGIQSLIKEGCVVKQLALCWQDRVNFILTDEFLIRRIQYQEEIKSQAEEVEIENKQQQFDVDFLIMSGTLSLMLKELLSLFSSSQLEKNLETAAA